MIKTFTSRPKPRNHNAKIAFFVALALSAIGFVIYLLIERYRGVVGMVALLILVTAILIYTKYISPSFCYDVAVDSSGTPMFVVRQIIGKRITTLCRIDLADVTEVKLETRAEMRAHKTPKEYKKYVYAPTMFPPDVYRITVVSRYEKAEIVIEINEELAEIMRCAAVEARELRALSGEE